MRCPECQCDSNCKPHCILESLSPLRVQIAAVDKKSYQLGRNPYLAAAAQMALLAKFEYKANKLRSGIATCEPIPTKYQKELTNMEFAQELCEEVQKYYPKADVTSKVDPETGWLVVLANTRTAGNKLARFMHSAAGKAPKDFGTFDRFCYPLPYPEVEMEFPKRSHKVVNGPILWYGITPESEVRKLAEDVMTAWQRKQVVRTVGTPSATKSYMERYFATPLNLQKLHSKPCPDLFNEKGGFHVEPKAPVGLQDDKYSYHMAVPLNQVKELFPPAQPLQWYVNNKPIGLKLDDKPILFKCSQFGINARQEKAMIEVYNRKVEYAAQLLPGDPVAIKLKEHCWLQTHVVEGLNDFGKVRLNCPASMEWAYAGDLRISADLDKELRIRNLDEIRTKKGYSPLSDHLDLFAYLQLGDRIAVRDIADADGYLEAVLGVSLSTRVTASLRLRIYSPEQGNHTWVGDYSIDQLMISVDTQTALISRREAAKAKAVPATWEDIIRNWDWFTESKNLSTAMRTFDRTFPIGCEAILIPPGMVPRRVRVMSGSFIVYGDPTAPKVQLTHGGYPPFEALINSLRTQAQMDAMLKQPKLESELEVEAFNALYPGSNQVKWKGEVWKLEKEAFVNEHNRAVAWIVKADCELAAKVSDTRTLRPVKELEKLDPAQYGILVTGEQAETEEDEPSGTHRISSMARVGDRVKLRGSEMEYKVVTALFQLCPDTDFLINLTPARKEELSRDELLDVITVRASHVRPANVITAMNWMSRMMYQSQPHVDR